MRCAAMLWSWNDTEAVGTTMPASSARLHPPHRQPRDKHKIDEANPHSCGTMGATLLVRGWPRPALRARPRGMLSPARRTVLSIGARGRTGRTAPVVHCAQAIARGARAGEPVAKVVDWTPSEIEDFTRM